MDNKASEILKHLTQEDIKKLKLLSGIFGSGQAQLQVKMVTLKEGIREYEKYAEFNLASKSVALIKTANRRLLHFFPGNIHLHTIETKDAENLFRENSKTAPSGAFNYNRVYRAMFNRFKIWRCVSHNPFVIKLPARQKEEPVVISREHISQIYRRLIEKGKPVIADMVVLAVDSGIRLGEEANLGWTDIDFKNRIMTIGNKLFVTKSRRIRKIPLNNRMEEILIRNSDRQLGPGKILREFVFVQKNGKPYKLDTVSKAFKKVVRELELPEEYNYHKLRSTAASNWVNRKVPIYTVQKLLGHSSVNTTAQAYAKVDLQELREAVNKL
jgi:integrase